MAVRHIEPYDYSVEPDVSAVELSVIVALFNEALNIEPLYWEIVNALDELGRPCEILFVDDGSTDDSGVVIDRLSADDQRVLAVHLRRNFGKAAALSVGFKEAGGGIVVTMDGDLQDNPAEIPRFVEQIEAGYDLVSGWKYPRQDPISKTLPSKLFNKVVGAATGLKLHDFNCGFKAYSRNLVDRLSIYGELHRYIPALAFGDGFRVSEIQVEHRPRAAGRSKYGWERYTRGLLDLLTVLFITRYTRRPLHLFGSMGLVLIFFGFGILAYLTALWFLGNAIGHRPLLTLGVLLSVLGVQFVSTGLLGEMITHSHKRNEEEYIARKAGTPERGRRG